MYQNLSKGAFMLTLQLWIL